MSELFHTLGINVKSLGFQILNFAILVVVLRLVAYKPLLKMLRERRERIEYGLKGADEADKRLAEIDEVKDKKLKEADQKAVAIVADAENTAKKRSNEIVTDAQSKAGNILEEAGVVAKQKADAEMDAVYAAAGELVRSAIERTCELDPSAIDQQLIDSAIKDINQQA
jgi:F-type H+-transporting ATPase subunit b